MHGTDFDQEQRTEGVPYPNLPPLIESRETEYRGSGIPSSVAIAGHPIHPVLVTFPVTLLTTAAAIDIVYWITNDYFWARMGVWAIGLGLLTGILAAITGMADFIRVPRVRKRTAGWAHMILNIIALVLTLANFSLRLSDPARIIVPVGVILSVVVAVCLGISGWYGGELAYRHKIGVIGSGETHTS